jgi:hypothetical protein
MIMLASGDTISERMLIWLLSEDVVVAAALVMEAVSDVAVEEEEDEGMIVADVDAEITGPADFEF